MLIKAIHIDDQLEALQGLKNLLASHFQDKIQLIGSFWDVNQGINAIDHHQPDLVFMDIEMNDLDGFEAAKLINNKHTIVVFLTGKLNYVIDAIQLSELPYILKPVREIDIQNLLLQYQYLRANNFQFLSKLLFDRAKQLMSESASNYLSSLVIHSINKIDIVPINQIYYIESKGRFTAIYTKSGQIYQSSKGLAFYQNFLESLTLFVRCHRSYLVNLEYVNTLVKTKYAYQLVLVNGKSIDVSFLKKKEIYRIFMSYNKNKKKK